MCVFLLLVKLVPIIGIFADNDFKLTILHFNDFHARFEPTSYLSGPCKHDCIGGFSRLYATIQETLKNDVTNSVVVLSSGDQFQGTLWYNIYGWNVTQHFLNKLPLDAMTLGDHEFDDKISSLTAFLQRLKIPVVVSNIDASREPSMRGLFQKSIVIEKGGKKIGIIGALLSNSFLINNMGNLKVLDEVKSINEEAARLVREENVFTNIVLCHCGYEREKLMAKEVGNRVSIIVGGHTHSFLYTGKVPNVLDVPIGPYPTIIRNINGNDVLVVQASAYTKYLGNLTLFFNSTGSLVDWSGNPIFLDSTLPTDKLIDDELTLWEKSVDEVGKKIIGQSLINIPSRECFYQECLLGNIITDAMMLKYTDHNKMNSSSSIVAMMHAGGMRSGLEMGNITYEDIVAVSPFSEVTYTGEIEGVHIRDLFESSVKNLGFIHLYQVSGMQVHFNLTNVIEHRVQQIQVRSKNSNTNFEDLDYNKTYRLIVPGFLVRSTFSDIIGKNLKNVELGNNLISIIENYLKIISPITNVIEGRISIFK